jgi:hypothetical protein
MNGDAVRQTDLAVTVKGILGKPGFARGSYAASPEELARERPSRGARDLDTAVEVPSPQGRVQR